MNRFRRFLRRPAIIATTILFATFVILHGIAWHYGAKEMHGSVEHWVGEQRQAGLEVRHGKIAIKGYPFFLRAEVLDVLIADRQAWRWSAPRLDIDLTVNALDQLTFRPRGQQSFWVNGIGPWQLDFKKLRASLKGSNDNSWSLNAQLTSGRLSDPARATKIDIAAAGLSVGSNAADPDQIGLSLEIKDSKVVISAQTIDLARLEIALFLTGTDTLNADIAAWRNADEHLIIQQTIVEIDGSRAVVSGQLSIDQEYYPVGSVNTEIQNPAGIARALGKVGIMDEQQTSLAEANLTLAAIAQGGKINAPIIFEDGQAKYSGITLATLPRLNGTAPR